ncbi:GatB/YqeY domain-containing protein [Candidatus Nomurabacteria bacterium]|nr:GatB/YqeY domain-containing protein [Candidatus Nomurabacteria bacterium]
MSLHEQIKGEIKTAMMAKDAIRLDVMRGLVTAFTNELVATNRTPTEFLTDEQTVAVISRIAKQRKDSIDQFTKGGRMDLVEKEVAELNMLEVYLPKLMSKEEVEKIVKDIYEKESPVDASKKGMFMSVVMKELKGKADGAIVKDVVDSLFI